MITMTLREALNIQAKQITYYSTRFPSMKKAAEKATKVDGFDLDAVMDVTVVNDMVPRGCNLGYLIGVDL